MKNGLLLLCFCLSFSIAFAQKSSVEKSLKIYFNAVYDDQMTVRDFPDIFQIETKEEQNLTIGHFSPAISFLKGKYYVEAEVSKLFFGLKDDIVVVEFVGQDIFAPIAGELKTTLDIVLRAEAGVDLFPKSTLIRPILSIGFQPYISTSHINPVNSLIPSIQTIIGGTDVQFIPRFQLFTDKKLFIDFNLIFSIVNFGHSYYREEAFGLIEEQTETAFYSRFFSKQFGARLGFGYRLSQGK